MDFNIPRKHFFSDDTQGMIINMPSSMSRELKSRSKAYGWSTAQLIDLVLDQYLYALAGRTSLPEHTYRFDGGSKEKVSLRLDKAVYKQIEKWSERTKHKLSQIVILALDTYLSQK